MLRYELYPVTNNLISIISIDPGIPKSPTIIDVIIFNPIWKFKNSPTRFIRKIIIPPITEFIINFNIVLSGTIKIFPKINKKNKHAVNAIILLYSK